MPKVVQFTIHPLTNDLFFFVLYYDEFFLGLVNSLQSSWWTWRGHLHLPKLPSAIIPSLSWIHHPSHFIAMQRMTKFTTCISTPSSLSHVALQASLSWSWIFGRHFSEVLLWRTSQGMRYATRPPVFQVYCRSKGCDVRQSFCPSPIEGTFKEATTLKPFRYPIELNKVYGFAWKDSDVLWCLAIISTNHNIAAISVKRLAGDNISCITLLALVDNIFGVRSEVRVGWLDVVVILGINQ